MACIPRNKKNQTNQKRAYPFFRPYNFYCCIFSVIFVTCRQIDLDPEGQYNH